MNFAHENFSIRLKLIYLTAHVLLKSTCAVSWRGFFMTRICLFLEKGRGWESLEKNEVGFDGIFYYFLVVDKVEVEQLKDFPALKHDCSYKLHLRI